MVSEKGFFWEHNMIINRQVLGFPTRKRWFPWQETEQVEYQEIAQDLIDCLQILAS
jgi:hypothetical protein